MAYDPLDPSDDEDIAFGPDMVRRKGVSLKELIDAHIEKAVAAHLASAISRVATSGISATDVEAALVELDAEKLAASEAVATATANKVAKRDTNGKLAGDILGNAATATKLATGRSISATGDVTWIVTFDGSGNATAAATVGNDSHSHTAATLSGVLADAAHSFATNGYQKLSNGWIIQWGEATVAANTTSNVTLPISYPTAHLQAFASNSTDLALDVSQSGGAAAPNGLSQIAIQNIDNSARLIRWFSIGH